MHYLPFSLLFTISFTCSFKPAHNARFSAADRVGQNSSILWNVDALGPQFAVKGETVTPVSWGCLEDEVWACKASGMDLTHRRVASFPVLRKSQNDCRIRHNMYRICCSGHIMFYALRVQRSDGSVQRRWEFTRMLSITFKGGLVLIIWSSRGYWV